MLPDGYSLADDVMGALAIAPDDSAITFAAGDGTTQRLYVKWLNRTDPQPIAGAERAVDPFFSPDGRWIGFFANGQLKKVSIADGTLVGLTGGRGQHGGQLGAGRSCSPQATRAAWSGGLAFLSLVERRNALVGLMFLQQAEDAMAKQPLGAAMVDIGHGHPLAARIPPASGTKSMDRWMKSSRLAEGLDDGDHAGKDGGSLGVTRRTDVSLTTGEQEQPLAAAGVATKPLRSHIPATRRRGNERRRCR